LQPTCAGNAQKYARLAVMSADVIRQIIASVAPRHVAVAQASVAVCLPVLAQPPVLPPVRRPRTSFLRLNMEVAWNIEALEQ
jgi:hypothetical protein